MRRGLLCTALLALLASGCGNERQPSAVLQLEPSAKTKSVSFPASGVELALPRNYQVLRRKSPEVFRGSLGDAFVAVFAYRRREQLPRNARELAAARRRLVAAVTKRSDTFKLTRSKTRRFAGLRAVDLIGDQTISSGRLRTRSLHVYKGSVEYVIELLSPVAGFESVETKTLPVIERSLKVTGTLKAKAKRKKRRKN